MLASPDVSLVALAKAKSVNLTLQAVAYLGSSLEETQRQLAELKEGR